MQNCEVCTYMSEIKIPKNQIHWESLYNSNKQLCQIVTSDKDQDKWFLYNVLSDGDLEKIEVGKSPIFKNRIIT